MCRELLSAINAARTSIDFAIYGVRVQPDIVNALGAAERHQGAVRVRTCTARDCWRSSTAAAWSEALPGLGAMLARDGMKQLGLLSTRHAQFPCRCPGHKQYQ
jgi:hypothetical protein